MTQNNLQDQHISFWDHALNWFQIYGKQVAVGVTLIFLSCIMLLFVFTKKSDSHVSESISADMISDKLLEEPSKLENQDRIELVDKLITITSNSSTLFNQYQGLIGQELLISQDPKKAEKYLKSSSSYLQKNGQQLFSQVGKLSELISHQEWDKAKTLSDTLLALPEFNSNENHESIFMTYSYIMLARLVIFQKTHDNSELLKTESQLKDLLGINKKPAFASEEKTSKLFNIMQDGSVSFFDICKIIQ